MKTTNEEPLTAIILKAFGIVSTITAGVFFVKFFTNDVRAAVEHAGHLSGAIGATASAISLWWMGSILALLDRIARTGERQPATGTKPTEKVADRKPLLRPVGDAYDEVPAYKL